MALIDLDDLLNLEEQFLAVGQANGQQDGEQLLGLELGYYTAFVEYWLAQVNSEPSLYSSRAAKQLASLATALEAFPTENRLNIDALALLDRIRAKFKTISTILGTHRLQSYVETTPHQH
ncbi:hypothetical protein BDF19DRAFT_449300 [Syncephalis fuscata]|nr:hypothetical protein BDF19DRAFT_449300 [Syncephalis fuscata]